jgi:hypothetical protein
MQETNLFREQVRGELMSGRPIAALAKPVSGR